MSQETQIKTHLENGNAITPMDALNLFGCLRLAARISDLRESGMNIKTDIVENDGKRYAKYYMLAKV